MARSGLLPLIVLVLAGCASSGTAPSGGDRSVLSQVELEEFPSSTVYDVIERRRPEWLRSRGTFSLRRPDSGFPVVYINDVREGDLRALRSLQALSIMEIRYFSGPQATQRWGTGVPGGVIAVTTK
jgi:hypothetical protein